MAHPGRITDRLRMWAMLLVALAVSGLIVFMSSYSAFDPPTSNPTATTPNPTATTSRPTRQPGRSDPVQDPRAALGDTMEGGPDQFQPVRRALHEPPQ